MQRRGCSRAVTTSRDYWVRVSLRELLPQLDPERFWQVHRGTVVNIDAGFKAGYVAARVARRIGNCRLAAKPRAAP